MKLKKGKGIEGVEVEEIVEEEATDTVGLGTSAPTAPLEVSLKPAGSEDNVIFIPSRVIDPAPRVGNWKAMDVLKVTRLQQGQQYPMPRHVAQILQDAKAGTIVG